LSCGCFEVDHHLFTGFLSALSSFTKATMKREMNTVLIEDLKFVFEKNNDLYFILCADKSDNNILLHKKLIRIQAHFLHKYKDILINWNGEISQFEPFGEKIDKIISCSVEGTVMYCENCEHIITGEFHTKKIDFHDFYFCCENCQEHFEDLCSEYIRHSEHHELT
jgi:hypothetical protein